MLRYNHCLLITLLLFAVTSCHKSSHDTKPTVIDSPVVYDNYTVLTPGNYWIYQEYKLDSVDGPATALGRYDSCYVEKDTTINDKTYHKYIDQSTISGTPYADIYFLRDSLGYTVSNTGKVVFAVEDFTTVFEHYYIPPGAASPDTQEVTVQMGFKDVSFSTEAGTFVTRTLRRIYRFPASYPYGPTREYDYRYAKGIGLVTATTGFFTATPEVYERRLVRYHARY